MTPDEEPLGGGNVNEVTRQGERVFRTAGEWTPAVQRLLTHLRSVSLSWVPAPLGIDADGREVVGFIAGTVPSYPMPEWIWSDDILRNAAGKLRQLHEATAGYVDREAHWRQPAREPREVICHNDFAPYNMVFEQQRITGVIDFDMASPGPRLWDLAYLAYRLIPLTAATNPDGIHSDMKTRLSRLDALIASYGTPFSSLDVLEMAQQRLQHLARFSEELADETGRLQLREHGALYRSDIEYIQQLLAGLTAEPGTTA